MNITKEFNKQNINANTNKVICINTNNSINNYYDQVINIDKINEVMDNKVLELSLIENNLKKKKNNNLHNNFNIFKNELYNTLDNIIELDFTRDSRVQDSDNYIKENLVNICELYININRHIKKKNLKLLFIKNIVDELINNIIYRCETNNNNDNIKLIKIKYEKKKKNNEQFENKNITKKD